jgi:hypothetical protein
MRDEKDPGTLEMPLKRHRGRPPIGDQAMSAADRAFRYRQRRRRDLSPVNEKTDVLLVDGLKKSIQWAAEDPDMAGVLDMYIEELVRRHHSKGAAALK